jgi:autotransporter passenger strand-loop-strand repeat protein
MTVNAGGTIHGGIEQVEGGGGAFCTIVASGGTLELVGGASAGGTTIQAGGGTLEIAGGYALSGYEEAQ